MSGKKSDANKSGIVPLGLPDLDSAHRLDQICFPRGVAFSKNLFLYFLTVPDCAAFGVRTGKKLDGFVIVQARSKTRAQLVTLDICPEQRRKKLGQSLLEHAHDFLRRNGFKLMVLETAVNNRAAIALYEKLGYERTGISKRFYPDGTDALLMEKKL